MDMYSMNRAYGFKAFILPSFKLIIRCTIAAHKYIVWYNIVVEFWGRSGTSTERRLNMNLWGGGRRVGGVGMGGQEGVKSLKNVRNWFISVSKMASVIPMHDATRTPRAVRSCLWMSFGISTPSPHPPPPSCSLPFHRITHTHT